MRSRPNVIVVVLDCVRAFDVSYITPEGVSTTPTLDRLAQDCLTFSQASSPSCWTLPSHASLFTGLMPSRHGAHELSMRLPGTHPTLAELLAQADYLTVGVSCNDLVGPATGLSRGFARFFEERDALPNPSGSLPKRMLSAIGPVHRSLQRRHNARRFAHDHGGERATALIANILRSLPQDRPLHLFVNYLETHLPYQPPPRALAPFLPPGASLEDAYNMQQRVLPEPDGRLVRSTLDWQLLHALYRGSLRYADELLGRLLRLLEGAGRLEDSMLVITSDHGENVGDHGLVDHQCSLHDSVLRIPLLVRLPGAGVTGVRDDLAMLLDVVPTVCEVVGIPIPPTQGESLTSRLQRSYAIAEYLAPHPVIEARAQQHPDIDWSHCQRRMRSIRTASRKYIAASDGHNELYDLVSDPMETTNLYGGHPEGVDLAQALGHWEATESDPAAVPVAEDSTLAQRLAALGYLD